MNGATMFSGIGAPEQAAPWIDWKWSADIDDFANAVRSIHWPDVPNLGDVNAIDSGSIPAVDLLVFGSPCQSFSVAGKRLGLDDPRGNMALGVVARVRPRWFVFENVPGLFSSFSGSESAESSVRDGCERSAEGDEERDLAAFLTAVRECGYSGVWRVLDAQYAGVPQRRRRVFFVGCLGNDWRPSACVLFERESLRRNSPPGRESRQDVAGPLTASLGKRGGIPDAENAAGGLIPEVALPLRAQGQMAHDPTLDTLVAGCEFGPSGGRFTDVSPTLDSRSKDGPVRNQLAPAVVTSTGDVAHCLNAGAQGRQEFESGTLIAFSCKDHGGDAGPTAPTLRSMTHDASHMNGGGQVAIAIQERAVSANPASGPDGAGVSEDVAFTMEARTTPQAVAMNLRGREDGAMAEADHLASLRASDGGSSRSYIAFDTTQITSPENGSNPQVDRPCHALQALGHPPTMANSFQVRRITPTEAERLQGFPDGFTNIPWRGKNGAPDTRRYKALGNSMAVPVMRWILDRLRVVDDVWDFNQPTTINEAGE